MGILQVLFGEKGYTDCDIPHEEIIEFIGQEISRLKYRRCSFELLPIKFLLSLKSLFCSFPHSCIFVK